MLDQLHPVENAVDWIRTFCAWFDAHRNELTRQGVNVTLPDVPMREKMYAQFSTDTHEAMVELWDYGFSEFYCADVQAEDDAVQVTHYEFTRPEELFAALDALAARLAGHALPQAVTV